MRKRPPRKAGKRDLRQSAKARKDELTNGVKRKPRSLLRVSECEACWRVLLRPEDAGQMHHHGMFLEVRVNGKPYCRGCVPRSSETRGA